VANEGDLVLLGELIRQLKDAQNDKSKAEEEIGLWLERMKLAKDAGKLDLFDAAKERARRVRDELRAAESRIMDLEVQKKILKREVKSGRLGVGNATVARTHRLVESLKGTPMDPSEAKWDRLEKEGGAEDELTALKRKMGLD
jgi:hypothetical protein